MDYVSLFEKSPFRCTPRFGRAGGSQQAAETGYPLARTELHPGPICGFLRQVDRRESETGGTQRR